MEATHESKCSPRVNVQSSTAGLAWFGAWLFAIGYLHLSFWKAVIAFVIWPYLIGVHAGMLPR